MNKFPISIALVCFLVIGLSACSSRPERSYRVTEIKSVSHSLLALADKRRQQQDYEKAQMLYMETENYATLSNDKYLLGLAKLKRANTFIITQQPESAVYLIKQVESMIKFESVDLVKAVAFIKAKYEFEFGNKRKALEMVQKLYVAYPANSEQALYYKMVAWVYGDNTISAEVAIEIFEQIDKLKQQKKLNNIEIYSYSVWQLAKGLVDLNQTNAEDYILKSVVHFSELELSNKIAQSYALAAEYYQLLGQSEQANYFAQQADNITKATQ